MENKHHKDRSLFVQGPIPPDKLSRSVARHESKTDIGAHSIFLGQIRADEVGGRNIEAIEYTAYEDMANAVYREIREEAFARYDLSCAHVYHSLGRVAAGELCFYVFTSSERRKEAMEATGFFVEQIKKRVPIFGKEWFADRTHQWKENT